MKIIFKGGFVYEVDLAKCFVSFGLTKVVINWVNDSDFRLDAVGESWTIPYELIEDVNL